MEATQPSTPAAPRTRNTVLTVLITLAAVFAFEKVFDVRRTSDYEARAKRSEALLTAQEQRTHKYDEYYQRIEEDEQRTRALLERQEQANARFQEILTTWERQQKEYQGYLDSLKHPK